MLTAKLTAIYYERFKNTEVTFTKELIETTGLITEQVSLKCGGDFWPCVFCAASFNGTKIAVNFKSGLSEKLRRENNSASIRLCFKAGEKGNTITFFVAGRVVSSSPYKDSDDVSLLNIQFTKRPPDDLIGIIGRVLDAEEYFRKYRDVRIALTTDIRRKLRLVSNEAAVFIQAVPRRCLLRELSFTGVKLITIGIAKFIVDKETSLRFDFEDPGESILVKGKFTGFEEVKGKKDMVALSMEFDESQIPLSYKIRIYEYMILIHRDRTPVNKREIPLPAKESQKTPAKKLLVAKDDTNEVAANTDTYEDSDLNDDFELRKM